MIYSGKTGTISVGGKDVAHMGTWSLSIDQDIHEVASFGNRYMEKVATILDWSADADGTADFETASGQKDIYDALISGELVELKLMLDETTGFSGQALVESFSVDHDAEGAAEVSISLSGSGAVVLDLV